MSFELKCSFLDYIEQDKNQFSLSIYENKKKTLERSIDSNNMFTRITNVNNCKIIISTLNGDRVFKFYPQLLEDNTNVCYIFLHNKNNQYVFSIRSFISSSYLGDKGGLYVKYNNQDTPYYLEHNFISTWDNNLSYFILANSPLDFTINNYKFDISNSSKELEFIFCIHFLEENQLTISIHLPYGRHNTNPMINQSLLNRSLCCKLMKSFDLKAIKESVENKYMKYYAEQFINTFETNLSKCKSVESLIALMRCNEDIKNNELDKFHLFFNTIINEIDGYDSNCFLLTKLYCYNNIIVKIFKAIQSNYLHYPKTTHLLYLIEKGVQLYHIFHTEVQNIEKNNDIIVKARKIVSFYSIMEQVDLLEISYFQTPNLFEVSSTNVNHPIKRAIDVIKQIIQNLNPKSLLIEGLFQLHSKVSIDLNQTNDTYNMNVFEIDIIHFDALISILTDCIPSYIWRVSMDTIYNAYYDKISDSMIVNEYKLFHQTLDKMTTQYNSINSNQSIYTLPYIMEILHEIYGHGLVKKQMIQDTPYCYYKNGKIGLLDYSKQMNKGEAGKILETFISENKDIINFLKMPPCYVDSVINYKLWINEDMKALNNVINELKIKERRVVLNNINSFESYTEKYKSIDYTTETKPVLILKPVSNFCISDYINEIFIKKQEDDEYSKKFYE